MKPTRLLLIWLGVLAGLGTVLGTVRALGVEIAPRLDSIAWGLVLALSLLALLDALRAWRLPAPQVRRHLPGSLPLGRWSEVQLEIRHAYGQALDVQLFDHPPQGLAFEHLPQLASLEPGHASRVSYNVRPLLRGRFDFERCAVSLPSPLGLWQVRHLVATQDSTRVYPDFARLYGGQLLAVDNWLSQLGVRQRQRRDLGLSSTSYGNFARATACARSTGRPPLANARRSPGNTRMNATSRSSSCSMADAACAARTMSWRTSTTPSTPACC